jgi:oligopeptide transport system permease protein
MNQAATTPAPQAQFERGTSLWRDAWLRLRRNRLAVLCMALIIFIILACAVGPLFTGHDPSAQNRAYGANPPTAQHLLGTDTLGRDQMTRIFEGGKVSLAVGILATAVSVLIGVAYGATAGYLGGRVDAVLMRIVDIIYGLPLIIFVILVSVALDGHVESPGLKLMCLFFVIGAFGWLTIARVVRAQVQSLRRQEFIEAARSLGLSGRRIIFLHLIPNAIGPVIVYATLTVPANMLLEASLSFLGLGVKPPLSSWGILIKEGADTMETYPWLLIFPALFFSATLFCLNFIGDGLRDAMDVRASKD